jgi:FtsZ-binding cell division protein ZapB
MTSNKQSHVVTDQEALDTLQAIFDAKMDELKEENKVLKEELTEAITSQSGTESEEVSVMPEDKSCIWTQVCADTYALSTLSGVVIRYKDSMVFSPGSHIKDEGTIR